MEEIKEFSDAWEGDLVESKNKLYRVLRSEITEGGHIKLLKVVNARPIFPFVKVRVIYE